MTPPGAPLLSVRQLRCHYPWPGRWPWQTGGVLRAVDDISFDLRPGETLGVIGESGCGKSSLARTLLGLQAASAGSIRFDGQELVGLDARDWRSLRREIQMVFQDPFSSLDPRMTLARSVAEPLAALRPEIGPAERERRVAGALERVGIPVPLHHRFPHELSGGQCQRAGIARALVVEPRLLVCDEAVSALDVLVQAQVVGLLRDLQRERGLAMIFVAHDLAVVRQLSHRVLVMYLGRAVEQAPSEVLFERPRHPYTRALLSAVPGTDPSIRASLLLEGELPSAAHPPPGCAFATRCPMADEQCTRRAPPMRTARDGAAACHYA